MVVNLASIGGWRWIYWLHCIFSAVSCVLFIFCYFPPDIHQIQTKQTRLNQLKQIDYIGFVLYAGPLISLLLGLSKSTRLISLRLANSTQLGVEGSTHGIAAESSPYLS